MWILEVEPGVGYTTSDLQVRYIRAMTAATGRVLAEGTVIHLVAPHGDGRGPPLPRLG